MENISDTQSGMKKPIEFERSVLSLVRAEATEFNQILYVGPEAGSNYRMADAVAPSGFKDLPGPCIIEVKYKASTYHLIEFIERVTSSDIEYASFLFVINATSSHIKRISNSLNKKYLNIPFLILGKEELKNIANKHPDVALSFDRKYLNKAIGSFETRDTSKLLQQYINSLKSAFQEDQLVLFLGAGVSRSADLPDWPNLINRLTLSLAEEIPTISHYLDEPNSIIEYFNSEAPPSPLIAARLLRDSLEKKFPEKVRRALYQDVSSSKDSKLIKAVASICIPKRAHQGLVAVVTYNFDDLLETELERIGVDYHVVISEADTPSKNELPIYHPHGYLPRKGHLTQKNENSLVLSEEAYHSQFMDPYSWANITQLNLLRNHVCLFVGLGMTDPNLRRLLEISQTKKPGTRHYVILKDHWKPVGKTVKQRSVDSLARVFKGLEETSFNRLGVSIIWVNEYSEISDILSEIK